MRLPLRFPKKPFTFNRKSRFSPTILKSNSRIQKDACFGEDFVNSKHHNYDVKKKSYLILFLTFGCLTANAVGDDGPSLLPKAFENKPTKGKSDSSRLRDLELVIKTRRLLADDKDLGPFNIGVSVREGVLYLWGPVPDTKKIHDALTRVAKVKMIFEVKNEMYLGLTEDIPLPLFQQIENPASKTP